jgi:hypothetical protein
MSASSRLDARPWAAAHRTLLVLAALAVVIAAAVAVPLLVLRGSSAPAPAHAPAPVVNTVPLQPAPPACSIQEIGRPRPC